MATRRRSALCTFDLEGTSHSPKAYSYLVPEELDLHPGNIVAVPTKRGTAHVKVTALEPKLNPRASVAILRKIVENQDES